jgi:hypothetical protein
VSLKMGMRSRLAAAPGAELLERLSGVSRAAAPSP